MATNNKISWIPFCKELAKKLLEFRNDRTPLVEAVKRALECAYRNYNKDKTKKREIPTLQHKKNLDELVDIDPFTIIGLFGRETGEDIRAEIVKAFVADDVFSGLKSLVPENIEEDMDFGDMPKLIGTGASFCIAATTHEDFETLWELFDAAVKYANNPKDNRDLVKCFDSVASKVSQVKCKRISTALSWIAPELFMSLSENDIPGYIKKAELKGVPENVEQLLENFSGEEYFEILNGLKSCLETNGIKDFLELNSRACDAKKSGGSQSKKKKTQKEKDKPENEAQQKKEEPKKENETPTKDQYLSGNFLEDVFMGKDQYEKLVRLLKNKKNIILQGPPGVGKTFAARRLAYAMMGKKDKDRVEFVQFHQSYSYEDFVEGYKPRDEGKAKGPNEEIEEKTQTSSEEKKSEFELRKGTFHEFCKKAREKEEAYKAAPDDKDNWYFFIIDEINRGNTSKIFGELLMLIENDHRGDKTKLAYSREDFSVPENLFIIGMMNTADRSLAMIDYALRRRFAFVDMEPAFDSEGFNDYCLEKLGEDIRSENKGVFGKLIDWVKALNEEIKKDGSLGEGFCIGHSYFCGWDKHEDYLKNKDDPTELKTILEGKMQDVVECDIIPALEEYWFDNKDRVKDFVVGKEEGGKKIVGLPDKLQGRLGGKYAPSEGDNGK